MNTWNARLKERMKELGLTQEVLAQKMNITRGSIAHYLAANRTPPLKKLNRLAQILKCSPAWLQYGAEKSSEPSKSKTISSKEKSLSLGVPILEWNEVDNFSIKQNSPNKETEYVPCFCHQRNNSRVFALRLKGDVMTSPLGQVKGFHDGDLLIINPDKKEEHGDYVIAIMPNTKEATFKQYVIDSGIKYLKPLNPQYPMLKIEAKTQIYGVVVASLTLLRNI